MTQLNQSDIRPAVDRLVRDATVWDLHTHLYPPAFGSAHGRGVTPDPTGLMLWGVDDLVTYHYLIAEVMREGAADGLTPERFFALSQSEQADLIWRRLFVEATPLSEACRGVVTTLTRLGLDPHEKTLDHYRAWFAEQSPDEQIDRVLRLAGVERVTMTNDPFDDNERGRWLAEGGVESDPRFTPVLRIDPLVVDWLGAAAKLRDWGCEVDDALSPDAVRRVRDWLGEWIDRMQPAYCAMSLPPDWRHPSDTPGGRCLAEAIAPVCRERGLPLALMIGVTRQINPAIRLAGDTVGSADVSSLARLCRDCPDQRFLATFLARDNQYELAVTARKFANLTPFGCWWFLNTPSHIEEITRTRLELLGPTFIPQHSDCRILEQLIYKWDHSRSVIATVLADQYERLAALGFAITEELIERDARRLLQDNVASALGA